MNDQPQEITDPIVEKTDAKKKSSPIAKFIKKHKLMVSLLIAVIVLGIATSVALFSFIPVVESGNTKYVNIDTSAKIEKGQTVKLKYSDVSVEVTNFSNNSCPEGQKCYGTEPTVEYLMKVGEQAFATGTGTNISGSGYQVKTIKSDYKTYTEIKIVKE